MSEAQILRKQFDITLKMLQDSCPHEETEIMPYMWAPGHFGIDVKVCKNCERMWKVTGEPL